MLYNLNVQYTLQFADDQVIIANDKEYITRKLQEEYKLWGLEINTEKTKYLPIDAELYNWRTTK